MVKDNRGFLSTASILDRGDRMADDGGYSVWGAEDDFAGQPSHQSVKAISPPKRSSKLYDDLDETSADWDIQASQPESTKRRSLLNEALPSTTFESTSAVVQAPEDAFSDRTPDIEADLVDRLDSAGFDDFDEGQFKTSGDQFKDDDFGDFGEFEEDQEAAFDVSIPEASVAGPSREWRPLSLHGISDSSSVDGNIREILAPAFGDGRMYPFHDGAASQLSQDRVRQVEGEAQVLVREESRNMWHSLTSQPKVRPVDWMRSSTRRQHLIALGIPINLDEVRMGDGTGAKSLPPLSLKLDKKSGDNNGKQVPSRNGTPDSKTKVPVLDTDRANELTSLTEDQLTLLALPALRDISREMETLTRQASALLTHYLSQRESHNADAEMYNGLIRNLVKGAASKYGGRQMSQSLQASGSGASNSVKRSSTLRKASTNSGRNSPAPSTQNR